MHAANVWLNLIHKFTTISMNFYNKNVQAYISDFRNICGKLKNMKLNILIWIKNDRFTNSLQSHQEEFVRMKRDKVQDFKNKNKIKKLDLHELMNQLIAQAIDFKDIKPNSKTAKAENKPTASLMTINLMANLIWRRIQTPTKSRSVIITILHFILRLSANSRIILISWRNDN